MIEQYVLLLAYVLAEQRRHLVSEQRLIILPDLPLNLRIGIVVQLAVSHQHPQVLVLDMRRVPQDAHDNWPQRLDLDHREALDQQLLELAVPFLALFLANLVDVGDQFLTQFLIKSTQKNGNQT